MPALARCQVQRRARVVVAHVDRDLLLLHEPLHRVEVALGGGIDEVSRAGVRPFGAVRGPRVAQRLRGLVVVPVTDRDSAEPCSVREEYEGMEYELWVYASESRGFYFNTSFTFHIDIRIRGVARAEILKLNVEILN